MDRPESVALYARVSSQRQAEGGTMDSQVAALRERIAQDGLDVADECCFLDDGYSGALLTRPALERLRDLAHAGGLDRVYVHTPDRLARKYVLQMVLLEELTRAGVQVIFLDGDPRSSTAEGALLVQVQSIIAEYERAKILERTRRGRRHAARAGKVSALGHAPYGYHYVTRQAGDGEARYEIVLDEARVVRQIFTWVAVEGLSLGEVIRRLAEQHVPTATGKARWDRATIHGILGQPAYTGTAKYGKTRLVPRQHARRAKRGDPATPRRALVTQDTLPAEQESIPVPALISPELFAAAAERLAGNRQRQRALGRGGFLLSGLLVCHRCGSAYCGRHRTARRQGDGYYRCLGTDKYRRGGETICDNKSLPVAALENEVWADVCSLLQDRGRLRHELERRLAQPTPAGDRAHWQVILAQLKGRLARLVDAYEHGWLEQAEFLQRSTCVRERLAENEAALQQWEQAHHSEDELRLIVGHFETFAQEVAAGLDDADPDLKRQLIRLLIHRIEVDTEEVRIVYKVQPRPFVLRPVRGELQQRLSLPRTPSGFVAE